MSISATSTVAAGNSREERTGTGPRDGVTAWPTTGSALACGCTCKDTTCAAVITWTIFEIATGTKRLVADSDEPAGHGVIAEAPAHVSGFTGQTQLFSPAQPLPRRGCRSSL